MRRSHSGHKGSHCGSIQQWGFNSARPAPTAFELVLAASFPGVCGVGGGRMCKVHVEKELRVIRAIRFTNLRRRNFLFIEADAIPCVTNMF